MFSNDFDKFNNSFDKQFSLAGILFFIVFFLVLGIIIAVIVKNILTWHKNNNSPRLTVDAEVVTKRMSVSHHRHDNGINNYHTWYYVTFQVESGDRMELSVSGQEYGLLAEGDQGRLTFQGTRFISFERSI